MLSSLRVKVTQTLSKHVGGGTSSPNAVVEAGGGVDPPTSSWTKDNNILSVVSRVVKSLEVADPVREWTCWCGHKFRAPGEWYPTEPAMCEAPGCPNPKFFLTGAGREMLASGGPQPSGASGRGAAKPASLTGGKGGGGMGGRLGGSGGR